MSGAEIAAVVSGLVNLLGAVAGFFGWKKRKRIEAVAQQVERTGEAVIQGIEACEKVLGGHEAKQVKRSVQAVAEAAGVEGHLHGWLKRLGLSRR
jgi:hypothetical protein